MNNTPKCPYCGDRMELIIVSPECINGTSTAWYQCVVCESSSPTSECPANSPRKEIVKKALALALHRAEPENCVLTIEDIREIEDHNQDNRALIWIESQSQINLEYDLAQGSIQYINGNEFSFVYLDWEGNDIYRAETYKKTWRCWLRKPTKKEREAVPWTK